MSNTAPAERVAAYIEHQRHVLELAAAALEAGAPERAALYLVAVVDDQAEEVAALRAISGPA
jgi:hypothetical protein